MRSCPLPECRPRPSAAQRSSRVFRHSRGCADTSGLCAAMATILVSRIPGSPSCPPAGASTLGASASPTTPPARLGSPESSNREIGQTCGGNTSVPPRWNYVRDNTSLPLTCPLPDGLRPAFEDGPALSSRAFSSSFGTKSRTCSAPQQARQALLLASLRSP